MTSDSFVQGAVRVYAGPPLALAALASVLLAIGEAGGLPGLPLLAVTLWWVWTYAYLLVVATAHGRPLPVLAIESTNPWHEPRPLLQLALLAAAAGLAWWLAGRVGAWAALAVAAATLLVLPASLALLAVEGELVHALSPAAIVRVVAGLGIRYLGVLLLGGGYALLLLALVRVLPNVLLLAAAQLALFSLANALGASLYARRHALGLEAWQAPEISAALAARTSERERAACADRLYGLLRARQPAAAWAHAAAWLEAGGRDPEAYRWLRDRALNWSEARFADRVSDALVARLVALGRRAEALAEVEACWRRGGRYAADDFRDRDALETVARELGRDAALARLRVERGDGSRPN